MKRSVLLALPILLLDQSASAADSAGQFAVRGIGRANCEQFLKSVNEKSELRLIFGGWIDGYLTGINQYHQDTFDMAPWESTEAFGQLVKKNCENNPQANFFVIMNTMAIALKDDRLTESSPRVIAKSGDKQVVVYKVTLQQVQQKLKEKGIYQGEADGAFGPKTQAAIEAFQKAESLQVTGVPDQFTLWKLLRPSPPANN